MQKPSSTSAACTERLQHEAQAAGLPEDDEVVLQIGRAIRRATENLRSVLESETLAAGEVMSTDIKDIPLLKSDQAYLNFLIDSLSE